MYRDIHIVETQFVDTNYTRNVDTRKSILNMFSHNLEL